jgi:RNA polymerase sigma factor (sigma-70 family)
VTRITSMDSQLSSTITHHEVCLQMVRHLQSLPGFQLLSEDEFAAQILHFAGPQSEPEFSRDVRNHALHVYAERLYMAVAGDPVQQEKGLQELSRYLYRMAYNFYLGSALSGEEMLEKAQESTQAALEKIYLHLASVKTPASFLKWCGTVLRNVCLEEVRRRKDDCSLDEIEERVEVPADSGQAGIELGEEHVCLKAAVSRLKPEYQRVIQLTYFSTNEDGMKYTDPEIAARLGVSTGNLYTLRSRALAALRRDAQLINCMRGEL